MSKKMINLSLPHPKSKKEFIDDWVAKGNIENSTTPEKTQNKVEETPLKRLTIALPESLHKTIKLFCVQNNMKINDKVVEILSREFSNRS